MNGWRISEIATVLAIVIADQITKALVRTALPLGDSRTVIPGFLDLTHVQNTGAAFGLLNGVDFAYKPLVMIAIAAIALIAPFVMKGLSRFQSDED